MSSGQADHASGVAHQNRGARPLIVRKQVFERQDVIIIRQIRSLLYDQGFTIGGARQRLTSADAKEDQTQFKLLVKQMISELEDVLRVLKA